MAGRSDVPQSDGRLPIEERIAQLRKGLDDACITLGRRAEDLHIRAGGRLPSRLGEWGERLGRIRSRARQTYGIEELESLCRQASLVEEEIGRAEARF